MKSLFFAISLISITSIVRAAPCSPKSSGPCRPAEGTETDDAESEILNNIAAAQKAEPSVQKKLAVYLAARDNNNLTAEDRMAVFIEYRSAKIAQDLLYKNAIEGTADLYHVGPKHTDMITIGEPDELDKKFMTGLTATWRPEVTDSGPGVKLAVRIKGADGQPHYSGALDMNPLEKDPTKPRGRLAITLVDGRVLILKDTFKIAVDEKENLGYLAAAIYHETRHFNRLSWKDKSGKNRSWATIAKEERDAYAAEKRIAKDVFGLEQDDIDFLEAQYQIYAKAVETGIPVADDHMTPEQVATWKNHYEHKQVNIDEEYWKLRDAVMTERAKQLETQEREREERERGEENARRWKERVRLFDRRELENAAARCWYRLDLRGYDDDTIIGFKDKDDIHYFISAGEVPDLQGLNTMLLITRACDYVRAGVAPDKLKACNDAAPTLRNPMNFDLVQKIMKANSGFNAECAENILANASRITDSKSFDKVVTDYQKADKKKRADEAKKNGERGQRGQTKNPGEGRSRPPEEPGCSPQNGVNGCPK